MLIDDGRVIRVDDRWRATAGVADVRVPESIHALLAARLDALGENERRTMQVASIAGERFGADEVAALAPGLDVHSALGSLRRTGLVLEDRESHAPGRYRFKHLLMRDVAYAGLPKATRADLHEVFGLELDRSLGDRRDEFAEVLAYHAERAFTLSIEIRLQRGAVEPRARRALVWAVALGERARRREDARLIGANARVAQAALDALGEAATAEEHAQVALTVAEDRRIAADYLSARDAFQRSIESARAAGRDDLAAWSYLGRARVLAFSSDRAGGLDEFDADLGEAQRLFIASGDPGSAIEAGLAALDRYWSLGQLGEMLDRGAQLRSRAQEIDDIPRELLVCSRLVGAASQSARFDLATEYFRAAEELAARSSSRLPQWGRVARCSRLKSTGEFAAAEGCFVELQEEARGDGDRLLELASLRNRGELLLESGRAREAMPFIEEALALSVGTGEIWSRTELTADLGHAHAGAGDPDRAAELLAHARSLLREDDRYAAGYVAFSAARIHELSGRPDEAETEYRRSLDLFAQTEYLFRAAQVRLEYARFLIGAGRPADALREFDVASPLFDHFVAEGRDWLAAIRGSLAAARRS